MRGTWWTGLLALGALGACESADEVAYVPPTAQELLAEGQVFELDPDVSDGMLHARVYIGETGLDMLVQAPVVGGVFVGSIDDRDDLWVDELTVTYSSFALMFDIEARGFRPWMVGLEVRSASALRFPDTTWSDDGEIAITPTAGGLVTMRWDIRSPGTLGASFERTTALDASAMILSDEDRVEVLFGGETGKIAWQWAGFTFSSSLDLSLYAAIERE